MASDEDLKLSDLLRYYDRNCQAALVSEDTPLGVLLRVLSLLSPQDLLYRRTRSLANAETANKKLETAKAKNKGVQEVRGHVWLSLAEHNTLCCYETYLSHLRRLRPCNSRPVSNLTNSQRLENKVSHVTHSEQNHVTE